MNDSAVAVLTAAEILRGMKTVQSVLAPDLEPDELKLFAMVASRSGLDPFAKQIYAVKRKGRVTFQTGIDGYRSIAARTGMYDGQDEPEYGPACPCGDNRPAGHPEFATVRVYRKGVTRAIAATIYWHEYKPDQGEKGTGDVMWTRMPRVMIAKVAEALALRKAFPYDPERREGIGADVYTADEMAQADRPAIERPPPLSLAERAAARRAEIDTTRDIPDAAEASSPEPAAQPPAPISPAPAEEAAEPPVEADAAGGESMSGTSPAPLTKMQFVAKLSASTIDRNHASTLRLVMFPDVNVELTDEQRGALWAQLEAEQAAVSA